MPFTEADWSRYIVQGATTKSGTHLSVEWSQKHIAQACLAHLITSLDLVDPDAPDEGIVQCVAHGFHIFNRYCFAHGPRHFELQHSMCAGSAGETDAQLTSLRTQLCEKYVYLHERLGLGDLPTANHDGVLSTIEVVAQGLQDIADTVPNHTMGESK